MRTNHAVCTCIIHDCTACVEHMIIFVMVFIHIVVCVHVICEYPMKFVCSCNLLSISINSCYIILNFSFQYVYSKGTVLEKTVEYVRELLTQNDQLSATAKLAEKSAGALQVLQNQIAVLEKENSFLRAQMIQLGIDTSSNALNTRSLLTNSLTQSLLNTPHVVTPHVVTPPPVPNTTQLLMNLAQTLTSNPLLASLNHQQTIQQPASEAQVG